MRRQINKELPSTSSPVTAKHTRSLAVSHSLSLRVIMTYRSGVDCCCCWCSGTEQGVADDAREMPVIITGWLSGFIRAPQFSLVVRAVHNHPRNPHQVSPIQFPARGWSPTKYLWTNLFSVDESLHNNFTLWRINLSPVTCGSAN